MGFKQKIVINRTIILIGFVLIVSIVSAQERNNEKIYRVENSDEHPIDVRMTKYSNKNGTTSGMLGCI